MVAHLPMEISRITKFILQRGARVQATVTGKHYRRSSLIQGGLEVSCLVTVTMPGSIMNHLLIARYDKLLGELYLEPKDEEIMGTFLSVIRGNDFVGTNVCRLRLRQAQKIKRTRKFGQETFETCLERKTNDVIQF